VTLEPLPPSLTDLFAVQKALITTKQARQHGVSRAMEARRVAAGQLDRPQPGVLRLRAAPISPEQAVMAAVLATAGHAVASHRSAAALHGLDGCALDLVELSVTRGHRVQIPNLAVHHVQALDVQDLTVVDGVPTTGLARTLCDLGSVVHPDRVERAFDDARRRNTSVRWIEATAIRLHRPGQAGTGVLLRLIEQARADPSVRGSWFEKLVEDCLRSPALPTLVRQHRVHDEHGRLAGILDLAIPSLRLGVEAHSRRFHFGPSPERADENRDHRLARCGWEVLYVGWQHTKRPADLLSLVIDTAHHRRLQLGETQV
jgi:very-short-patch-repair endonuclease